MSDEKPAPRVRSWWSRTFGRSVYGLVFGENLADRNVAATLIGLLIVGTLCGLALTTSPHIGSVLGNLAFTIVGFYFGSRRDAAKDDDDA